MVRCTSAANFFAEVNFVHRQLRKLIEFRCSLHSYRGLVRELAERLRTACEEFGNAPGCPTYERQYEAAFDAMGFLCMAAGMIPLDRACIEQAYEFLTQAVEIGGVS